MPEVPLDRRRAGIFDLRRGRMRWIRFAWLYVSALEATGPVVFTARRTRPAAFSSIFLCF